VELPDKTLVATLVLATRYRHRPVLIGVAAAFAVQRAIAAIAGRLLYLLPERGVGVIAVGAGKLLVRRAPVRVVHRVTGGLFAVLALLAAISAITG
jgi:putative Ca2+/H+ antiporter (TMEM165/GDT1 family)